MPSFLDDVTARNRRVVNATWVSSLKGGPQTGPKLARPAGCTTRYARSRLCRDRSRLSNGQHWTFEDVVEEPLHRRGGTTYGVKLPPDTFSNGEDFFGSFRCSKADLVNTPKKELEPALPVAVEANCHQSVIVLSAVHFEVMAEVEFRFPSDSNARTSSRVLCVPSIWELSTASWRTYIATKKSGLGKMLAGSGPVRHDVRSSSLSACALGRARCFNSLVMEAPGVDSYFNICVDIGITHVA